MIQQLNSILLFYRPFILWSFWVNCILVFISSDVFPVVTTKLFLTLFIWYLTTETSTKRKLTFYKNLGISSLKLFMTVFIIDALHTIVFLLLIREFI